MTEQLFAINFEQESGTVQVSGELCMDSMIAIMAEADGMFSNVPAGSALNVDLAGVSRSDSTGLALLLDWMRRAQQARQDITFHNMPEQMLSIARASGLEQLLPLQ